MVILISFFAGCSPCDAVYFAAPSSNPTHSGFDPIA
jgi:hypothetical protein